MSHISYAAVDSETEKAPRGDDSQRFYICKAPPGDEETDGGWEHNAKTFTVEFVTVIFLSFLDAANTFRQLAIQFPIALIRKNVQIGA